MSRADAVRIGGMDRQTPRDWVHRFNAAVPKVFSTNGRRVGRRGCHRSSRPNWLRSWRQARTLPLTVSCAGGALT